MKSNMVYKNNGFTLLNILFALVIVGILVTLVVPSFAAVLQSTTRQTIINQTLGLLNFTRDQAVSYGSSVVICPSSSHICVSDWNQPLMVFVDTNKNNERDEEELILQVSSFIDDEENLNWRSFGGKSYISFNEYGTTGFQSGRILYCDDKTSPHVRAQIIVYRTGRSRVARDSEYLNGC